MLMGIREKWKEESAINSIDDKSELKKHLE